LRPPPGEDGVEGFPLVPERRKPLHRRRIEAIRPGPGTLPGGVDVEPLPDDPRPPGAVPDRLLPPQYHLGVRLAD
jgi:hypothetical protein